MIINHIPLKLTAAAILACSLTSCETPTGQGAAIGAGTGAIIGGLATNRVGGAALGAAAGALAGTLVGASVEDSQRRQYNREDYPVADLTERRGFVVSPYPPHHVIDVRGIPSGELVRDPSCDRLFVKP